MLCDELKEYTNPTYGSSYYDIDEVKAAIAELKDKIQMHDFFWEGCGFAKRGFKNTIAVSEAFDRLEAENAELKKKLMPCLNGDCILTCEVVEKYGKENAELKAKLAEKDKEIAELKAALERDFVAKKSAEKVLRDLLDCGLIKEWFYNGTFHAVLKADDPHLEIAELKAKLSEKDKEIESLKASHYAESVDAGMENRKLKRALWLARAERAKARKNYWYARCLHEGDDFLVSIDGSPVKYIGCIKRTNYDWLLTWSEVERKCLAKAEQYK